MADQAATSSLNRERWTQLIAGVICMIMIANLQYGWTLFVGPINKAHGWSIAAIQVAFSIFVALETWLTPVEGWIVDRIGPRNGPRLMVAFGGVFIALGWIINSKAGSLEMLYFGAVISGIGGGAIYATAVGQAVKWFPDRRGLAVGLTAAGFGAGAALTVVPIREVIANFGYESAFFWFGLAQGVIVFALAWLLRAPEADELKDLAQPKVPQSARSYTPGEVLMSPVFWVLYIMFILVSASGLMATAQIALIAKDYNIANVAILGGATALSVALVVDNICNGAARPLFGWVSDNIGREYTMAIAFGLGAVAYWLLGSAGTLAMGLRRVRRPDLPDLGRNLQPVPVDLYRQLRAEIRDREPEPALYGEGRVRVPGPGREHDQGLDRQLAHGVCGHRGHERDRRRLGAVRAQADALEDRGHSAQACARHVTR